MFIRKRFYLLIDLDELGSADDSRRVENERIFLLRIVERLPGALAPQPKRFAERRALVVGYGNPEWSIGQRANEFFL